MTSTKISDFLTPSPPCPHMELIHTIKFTQPHLLFHDRHPPPKRTSYMEAPQAGADANWRGRRKAFKFSGFSRVGRSTSRSVKPTETRRVVVRQRGGVTTRRRGRALAVNALLRRTTWDSASLSVPVAAAAAAGPFVEQMMRTMMNTLRHPPSSPTHCRATHMCRGGGEIRLGQGCDGGGGGGGRSTPKVALLLDTTTAFPLQMERNTVAVGRPVTPKPHVVEEETRKEGPKGEGDGQVIRNDPLHGHCNCCAAFTLLPCSSFLPTVDRQQQQARSKRTLIHKCEIGSHVLSRCAFSPQCRARCRIHYGRVMAVQRARDDEPNSPTNLSSICSVVQITPVGAAVGAEGALRGRGVTTVSYFFGGLRLPTAPFLRRRRRLLEEAAQSLTPSTAAATDVTSGGPEYSAAASESAPPFAASLPDRCRSVGRSVGRVVLPVTPSPTRSDQIPSLLFGVACSSHWGYNWRLPAPRMHTVTVCDVVAGDDSFSRPNAVESSK